MVAQDQNVAITMADVDKVIKLDDQIFQTDTGSPHYVRFVERLNDIDVVNEGRNIRYSDRYRSEGINVNFVERREGVLRMSTYERGVENMTLACGTGATAVALAEAMDKNLEEGHVVIDADGGRLIVYFNRVGAGFTDLVLEGPARQVFTGISQL